MNIGYTVRTAFLQTHTQVVNSCTRNPRAFLASLRASPCRVTRRQFIQRNCPPVTAEGVMKTSKREKINFFSHLFYIATFIGPNIGLGQSRNGHRSHTAHGLNICHAKISHRSHDWPLSRSRDHAQSLVTVIGPKIDRAQSLVTNHRSQIRSRLKS